MYSFIRENANEMEYEIKYTCYVQTSHDPTHQWLICRIAVYYMSAIMTFDFEFYFKSADKIVWIIFKNSFATTYHNSQRRVLENIL